ncbi:peptidylprolyl isomerase [Alcanivorax sp. JB21]|uniref:peptidylprolyl isomerase n=1 Tax=Alcanivorax limicola TaxID=2874102 RepID=UPI001CBAA90E|nr:peptidylprolyl isomerase [Alcanivorax limicola]MBZ2188001.1 peptidylprolyl isomerase [Alcanivorax limicola]
MHRLLIILAALLPLAAGAGPATQSDTAADPERPRVVLETSKGTIVIALFPDKAPLSVANFLQYVDHQWYDDTVFHRVIPGFMIQGGGFTSVHASKETAEPIRNEADNGLRNSRGTVAYARTGDPHSATSQFFINTVNNTSLDHRNKTPAGWGYTVFGEVIEGMEEVVDEISAVPTGGAMLGGRPAPNVPKERVIIKSARRLTDAP